MTFKSWLKTRLKSLVFFFSEENLAQKIEDKMSLAETSTSDLSCKLITIFSCFTDVKVLREVHHIVGSLVGALPRAPRQNSLMGLPLQLMPEEANVLLEYGKDTDQ